MAARKRRKKQSMTVRIASAATAAAAVLLAILLAILLRDRPAHDPRAGMIHPVDFVPSQLEALFAAEKDTGIPLEALGAVALARGMTLDRAGEVADAFTAAVDAALTPEENARHLVASLPDAEERTQAEAHLETLLWLGEIRRGKVYPLPMDVRTDYEDGWGDARPGENGARPHEGIDIFAAMGTPVYAACGGVVEKKGWLQLGGWRLGIRGDDGIYYYYAHMSEYADVEVGDRVNPGTLIGYVGDTGYGPEGTTGQFPPHLHFGMYQGKDDTERAFNAYPYLVQWQAETES